MKKVLMTLLLVAMVGCATVDQKPANIDTTPDEDGETYRGVEYAD